MAKTDIISDTILPPALAQLMQNVGSDPIAASFVGGMASLRQAIYDTLGAYPQENVSPYWYGFTLRTQNGNAIAANGTQEATIKISSDAAFIAKAILGSSTGQYLVSMRQDASDRTLQNTPVINTALVGTAERPLWLPKGLLLPGNTTISFDLADLSGAINEVYFYFLGFKIYGYLN